MSGKRFRYLAIAPNAWGAGKTIDAALRKCREVKSHKLDEYVVLDSVEGFDSIEVSQLYGPQVPAAWVVVKDTRRSTGTQGRAPQGGDA